MNDASDNPTAAMGGPNENEAGDRLLTVGQTAERLALSVRHLTRLLEQNAIPHLVLPGTGKRAVVRFSRVDLDAWLAAARRGPEAAPGRLPLRATAAARLPAATWHRNLRLTTGQKGVS